MCPHITRSSSSRILSLNPLLFPVLRLSLGAIAAGVLFAVLLRLRTDSDTHRRDWIRLGVLIGNGLLVVIAGSVGPWGLLPVLLFVACTGWVELVRCVEKKHGAVATPALLPILGALSLLGGLRGTVSLSVLGVLAAAWGMIALPMVITRRPPPMHGLLTAGFGALFISAPLCLLLMLVQFSYGAFAFLIFVVTVNDGFAAGFGRLMGRTQVCPQISPGKTLEGSLGNLGVCAISGYLIRYLVPAWPVWQVILVAAGISVLSLIGDLIASSLKREAGIKDFGNLLPVVGGVLDRFDSLLFATPVFYVFVWGMGG
ncbi:MAG: hypothetical protein EXS64_02930 [Candidatus Latescibacteria bacterium]|nr:hypothetical protein [Candidatus Latescibacterota bacterium]